MYRFTTPLTILALAVAHQLAYADQDPEVPSMTVRYSDLNLGHMEGAAALYTRIRFAADTVCAPLWGWDPSSVARFRKCVQSAIDGAVAKVDEPLLTSYALAHGTSRVPSPAQIANR
jgi:UrcA family protein